jgi:hypothetical protein
MKKVKPVNSIKRTAERIRKKGQRGDNVLVHLSPDIIEHLRVKFGADINPETGLPQFGLFGNLFGKKTTDPVTGQQRRTGLRKAFHGLHGVEKAVRPVMKATAPLAGSMVGTLFGGPMGSILGGAVGGALSSKKHPLDHALGGALLGLGSSLIMPKLAKAMNLNPDSTAAGLFGMNAPTWGEQLGLQSQVAAPGLEHQVDAPGLEHYVDMGARRAAGNFAQGLGLKNIMDAALLGMSVAGTLGARTKYLKEDKDAAQFLKENMQSLGMESPPGPPPEFKKKRYKKPPEGYRAGFDPQWQYYEDEPEYARGGMVKSGYIKGKHGGQSDTRPIHMPEGSYVMDATTVSLLGDGNSDNGAERTKQLEQNFMKGGITRDYEPSRNVRARVSDGEYIFSKKAVTNLGGGNNAKGSQILDEFRNNLRQQKGVKPFLPPKTKPFNSYVR